jgi:hypothetical protein
MLFTVGVMDVISQKFYTRALLPHVGAEGLARSGLAVNAISFPLIPTKARRRAGEPRAAMTR